MERNENFQDNTKRNFLDNFSNYDHELLFHSPHRSENVHSHYPFLVWFLNKEQLDKIVIFDSEENKGLINLCEIVEDCQLSSKCFGNTNKKNYSLYAAYLLPLTAILESDSFSLVYIDVSSFTLDPIYFPQKAFPSPSTNTIFLLSNLYSATDAAKKNIKIWEVWKKQFPSFEFSHDQGLLIFHTGNTPSDFLRNLLSLDENNPELAFHLRKSCTIIGQYWKKRNADPEDSLHNQEAIFEAKALVHIAQQKQNLAEKESRELKNHCEKLERFYQSHLVYMKQIYQAWSQKIIQALPEEKSHFNQNDIKNSIKSRICNRIRAVIRFLLGRVTPPFLSPEIPAIPPLGGETIFDADLLTESSFLKKALVAYRPLRVAFIAGEPNTPGVIYRCFRNAEACRLAGHETRVINAQDVSPDDINWADVMILWRVEFSGHISTMLRLAREAGTVTAFDSDDIVFKPHLAHIEIIDGIRTIGATEEATSRTFGNMRQTLLRTDFAVATTEEMRNHMVQELIPKHAGPLIFVLPNIFDDAYLRLARFSARLEKAKKQDDLIRIGYASGTRTHQRDFAKIVPALVSVFKQKSQVKLVLFREPQNHRPILLMDEYPELTDYMDRIEWRDTVPLEDLPKELARFDISIAPLETENVFCEAKSELKFFEAALANICSVVSPTGPFKRAVKHGVTGFLADTVSEWKDVLLTLINDETLRKTIAQNAYHDVLWNFSTQRQAKLCETMLQSLTNEDGATKAAETIFARKNYQSLDLPVIPASELLFEHDSLQESEVTVIVTSYNYSAFIIEALESIKAQTLRELDLIVVDDGSQDNSVDLIKEWAKLHKDRFNRFQLRRSIQNAGLGGARNIGIAASETLYSMQLDADNRLLPNACERLLQAMQQGVIGYAYPIIKHFGAGQAIGGNIPFNPLRLKVGNYIDAMAMVAKWAWAAAGGYYVQRDAMGWEDYDIWCRLAELGIQGTQVKEELAEYRAHITSMTSTVTEQQHHKPKVVSYIQERHPWIDLVKPESSPWKEE